MQDIPLNGIGDTTPQWLTRVLREGGYLTRGSVSKVETQSQRSNWAKNAVLRISYTADALGEKPASLFFKLCDPGPGTFGDSEVVYYTRVALEIRNPPIPHCYHPAYLKESGRYHLLLQDLSETHAGDIQPTWPLATSTMDALAQLHAGWWNHPELSGVGDLPDRNKIEKYVSYARTGLKPMLKALGPDLPQDWLSLIQRIFDRHSEKMIQRAGRSQELTFIHGDLNPGNILSPLGAADKTYLVDHQPFDWNLTVWLGVSDLTYIMVHWWEPEMRKAWEKPLLEYYHQQLSRFGVRDYPLDQLWDDYRLCAMQSLYVAAAWCVNPAEREEAQWLWKSQLQKTMLACQDLNCAERLL